jgi:hypothetical protein
MGTVQASAFISSGLAEASFRRGVSIGAGLTALTRMCQSLRSVAHVRANEFNGLGLIRGTQCNILGGNVGIFGTTCTSDECRPACPVIPSTTRRPSDDSSAARIRQLAALPVDNTERSDPQHQPVLCAGFRSE